MLTKQELFGLVQNRIDFMERMQDLTKTLASCIADYAQSATDRRLPWPAPVDLSSHPTKSVGKSMKEIYSEDALYDDQANLLVGRVPNEIDDSNSLLGKTEQLITDCQFFDDQATNKEEQENFRLWQHWKDHFFYALAEAHQPNTTTPTADCDETNCLMVGNDTTNFYAAIVIYAGSALSLTDGSSQYLQQRNPADKGNIANYLEGNNAIYFTNGGGNGNNTYQQWDMNPDDSKNLNNINDILYCINGGDLTVKYCP